MREQEDIEAKRAHERARWHRRAEDRKAKGLCLACGKHPPAQGRTRCETCARKRRKADIERHRRRTADRVARGLCPRCGKAEPVPGLTLCETCVEKRNRAGRARDARLRAEGTPRRDPARAKEYERERSRRLYASRVAAGTCTKCGKAPAREGRTTCEPCAERHLARDRERLARARAEGLPYGGRDPEKKRKAGRKHGRRRTEARRAAGLCIRCGNAQPAEGRSMCEPCRENRRAAKRVRHHERRAAGLCVRCAAPAPGGKAHCDPCAAERNARRRRDKEAKRAADRQRYESRRARGECTRCGQPANGAAECQACRDAARARYESRRAAGLCVSCSAPTFDGAAMCAPCSVARAERRNREAEYAARRRRYADRRARHKCVVCEAPSPGAARCEPCARRHAEGSGAYRGIPVWDPTWTVIELATGREHGPFDSEADVALCLAFERLSRDEVEILSDVSPMALLTAPAWE